MKKILACILLAVLLCGCAQQDVETTGDTTAHETLAAVEPTEPSGTKVTDGGSVPAYDTGIEDAYALAVMGEELVVFSGEDTTTLTRLTGGNRYINASITLNCRITPDMPSVQVNEKGISYYDGEALVTLGTGLKEIGRRALPEDMVGEPVASADRGRIYYCKENSLWELTVETGIHRMVKQINEAFSTATALLQNETVLQCQLVSGEQIFLSTQTGLTLWQGDGSLRVTGQGENWYARVQEGLLTICVYSTGEQIQMLLPRDLRSEGWYLEENSYWITASDLCCYDLATGMACSQLALTETVLDVAEDGEGHIWLLTDGGMLYCWDPAVLPSGDDTLYSSPRYTLENPDTAGYETLRSYATELETQYGISILYGKDAVAAQSWDFDLTGEFLVPILQEEMEKLSQWLSVIPDGMLRSAVEDTTGGTLYICLVRQITGSAEFGIRDAVGGTQFWDGDDAYVALAAGQSSGEALYHQLYHVLEVRMLSKSNACYEWDALNPKGFAYDYSYVLNQSREDTKWVEDDRYFVDTYSMSFPMEDRAQIFAHAMLEGQEELFATKAMQNKLLALCKGFRQAYGLSKSSETFLWEQYLETSLAYTK